MTSRRVRAGLSSALLAMAVAGCASPLERSSEARLREELIASNRAYLRAVAAGPLMEVSRLPPDPQIKIPEERRRQLDATSGPASYRDEPLEVGPDLLGGAENEVVYMSLRRAIELAVRHNLEIRAARLLPAIARAQLVQAEAAFDAVLFADVDWQKLDTPRPPSAGLPGFGSNQSDTLQLGTGIRKPLTTGGEAAVQTSFGRNFTDPSFFTDDTYYDADVLVSLTQPLLRNFGGDVVRARILLAQNARRQALLEMRREILDAIADTEQAYWDLVFARNRLLIQLRLLRETAIDRDRLVRRAEQEFDVSPVQVTQANSFVALRRADMVLARQALRRASDLLKRLINSPDLPIAGETLILPLEEAPDQPLEFSLLDAVTIALRHRPELLIALSRIEDTGVRLRVADNARLPVLNLSAAVRLNGIGDNVGESYENLSDGDYIDYILGAQFEMPIGNRGPEALYREQVLLRQAAVLDYQRAARDVVLEVKSALRDILTNYELIDVTRTARLAAAENLRVLRAQEEVGGALTPEFLDLRLQTQARLAESEVREILALTDYSTAVARLYRAMGTLLERNGIETVASGAPLGPEPAPAAESLRLLDPPAPADPAGPLDAAGPADEPGPLEPAAAAEPIEPAPAGDLVEPPPAVE